MIEIDEVLADSVGGSVTPAVSATVWCDGDLTFPLPEHLDDQLEVLSWRTSEDATESARTCDVTVAGQDPRLLPRSLDGILAPFGAEINLSTGADLGDLGVRLQSEGWFRVTASTGRRYDEYYAETDAWIPMGVTVECRATDRMQVLADARFERITTKVSGTVWSAIAALCDELVPVAPTHEVPDAAIPTTIFDTDDRVEAIDSIAKRVEARAVFDREGQLTLRPRSSGSAVWDIPDWSLLAVEEELSSEDFYNAVIAIGRDPVTQEEIRGAFYEDDGPTRWRTGLKKPYFYASPLLTTKEQCDAAARTTFLNIVHRRQSTVTISVPPHQGVEALDGALIRLGGDVLTGSVKRVERSGGRMGSAMTLEVWLPLEDSRMLL